MKTNAKSNHVVAPVVSDPVVQCQLPDDGGIVTMPRSECIYQHHGQPVGDDIGPIKFESDLLLPYRLPSGKKVVGTFKQCVADGGKLVKGFDSRETKPSRKASPQLFICRLPSGIGIVATHDQCQRDGGTIVGKMASPRRSKGD